MNLLEVDVPIVAAVNGDGLGATIPLFCDAVVIAEGARLADTHVRMGLVAGDGGVMIWPWLVGMGMGQRISAPRRMDHGKEAERIGLANYAVPQDQVMPTAMELARNVPLAVRWTKYSVNKILRDHVNRALDSSMFPEAATLSSEGLARAAQAVYATRQPRFKGR